MDFLLLLAFKSYDILLRIVFISSSQFTGSVSFPEASVTTNDCPAVPTYAVVKNPTVSAAI